MHAVRGSVIMHERFVGLIVVHMQLDREML